VELLVGSVRYLVRSAIGLYWLDGASCMTVRPAQQEDIPSIARVHVDSWRTTYQGIVADSFLSGLSNLKHEDRHRRYMARPGTFYFVADLPVAGIVGFLSGGPERRGDSRFAGELYAIYILNQHRRHGIGLALVQQWAASLRRAALNSALVWVLADNKPAVTFYERLGGKLLGEQMIEIGGESLRELAYGWEDLRTIPGGGFGES
jgi:ribosomal protein S18 acetylase RimI-like enzyme